MRTGIRTCILLIALFLASCGEDDRAPEPLQKWLGTATSNVVLRTFDGAEKTVGAVQKEAGQKPLILNTWATWCTPCVKELPALSALAEQGTYHVVLVATDKEAETAKNFLKKYNIQHVKNMWDPLGKVTRRDMGARTLPQTFVIDAQGGVQAIVVGEQAWDSPEMVQKIDAWLAP